MTSWSRGGSSIHSRRKNHGQIITFPSCSLICISRLRYIEQAALMILSLLYYNHLLNGTNLRGFHTTINDSDHLSQEIAKSKIAFILYIWDRTVHFTIKQMIKML